jgi:hypothetical protein
MCGEKNVNALTFFDFLGHDAPAAAGRRPLPLCARNYINARQKLTTVACINKPHTVAAQAFSQYCSAVIPGKVF